MPNTIQGHKVITRSKMSREALSVVDSVSSLARGEGLTAYLVGGSVRDLIMGVKNADLDIALESDAIDFARKFSASANGSLIAHHRFGTATVFCKKIKVDFATARRESYERPAALPRVERSSLTDDLYRRDFTINAMAAAIDPDGFGRVIDPFGGLKDLKGKVIRALHEGSFIDDPTRIFRAVRFEQRLGFRIEPRTQA